MTYPPESKIRLPLLELAKDTKIHSTEEAEKTLADYFQLSTKQKNELKSSGGERLFLHKLRWSRTNLRVAGLIQDPKIAHFQITKKGIEVLKNPPTLINDRYLAAISPEYAEWRRKKQSSSKIKFFKKKTIPHSKTKEGIEKEYKKIEETASQKIRKFSDEEKNNLLENFEMEGKTPKRNVKTSKSRRFERDPKLAALMKDKHNHTCQLCQKKTFQGKDGNYYTESHHIIPVSIGGPDVPSNILIVCPTCHKIFDSGSESVKIQIYQIMKKFGLFDDFEILKKKKVITLKMYSQLIK